jgi:hypothetical protein
MTAPGGRLVVGCLALSAACMLTPARAIPPPPAPKAAGTASPTPNPGPGNYLPVGSSIEFVLDDPVDSKKTKPGTVVRLRLVKALVVGGIELAPAGAPETMKVVSTQPALAPDVDGSVKILLDPLALPGRGLLPVSAAHEYITIDLTAGQNTTNALEDTAKDIFIPGHFIYRQFRKGRELMLPTGSVLRARTAASVDASGAPNVVIATPPPFHLNTDVPHAAFTTPPLYTIPTPPPKATQTPTPAATPTAPAPTPTA